MHPILELLSKLTVSFVRSSETDSTISIDPASELGRFQGLLRRTAGLICVGHNAADLPAFRSHLKSKSADDTSARMSTWIQENRIFMRLPVEVTKCVIGVSQNSEGGKLYLLVTTPDPDESPVFEIVKPVRVDTT